MSNIKIGWSEVSLVPKDRKVRLFGQFYERISGEVETPISATGLAIESDNDCVIFVASDLIAVSHNLLDEVRARLPESFPKDKLITSAIHTHTSIGYPGYSDTLNDIRELLESMLPEGMRYKPLVSDDDPDLLFGNEAREFIIERIVKAAISAWENRKEACYATGFGRAAVGMCRRACYDDGSAKMWGDTNSANFTELESGNDSGIEMLFTYGLDKKLTGVVVTVACPAQVLEHNNFISSDYMGKLKRLIREKYGDGVNLLGLIAPAGDMCPRDLIRWVDAEFELKDPNIYREKIIPRRADPSMFDIKGCEKVAKRIANEVFWALDEVAEYVTEAPLIHKNIMLDLPLRRVTPKEYEASLNAINNYIERHTGDATYEDNAKLQIHTGNVRRYMLQQTKDMFDAEIHVLRLGDVAFATSPFELFINYGNQIRARSLAKQSFLVQLSCGCFTYLPTEKAEKGSHYSAFIGSGMAGHEAGDMLVRKTLSEINSLFEEV